MKQLLTSLGLLMFGLHCTYSCHHFIQPKSGGTLTDIIDGQRFDSSWCC